MPNVPAAPVKSIASSMARMRFSARARASAASANLARFAA
jgi:hypothetical protein